MDFNNSFSTFYPNYFNNQSGSASSWSPNLEDHETNMGTSSEKFKAEDDFDYHVLIESIINSGLDRVDGGAVDTPGEDTNLQPGSPLETYVKNINWSDFDDNYFTRSLTRQFAKTSLNANQSDFLSQLQADWQTKNTNTNKPLIPCGSACGGMGNINSMFSRMLDEGYETKLNSSRSSDNSTNRTSLTGTIGSVPTMNNPLVGSMGYNGMGGPTLMNNSMMGQPLITSSLGTMGGLNQSLSNVNNLGNNISAQLLRNHLINNQLLNRQMLNNQLINSQILASPNLFSTSNLANAFRNIPYSNEYLVNGQFVGKEYVPGDFIPGDYMQSNFNLDQKGLPMNLFDYNYGYTKFCKPQKSQFPFKNFKNRQVRKKRNNKTELLPLPSLKDAEFERAVDYLKETLLSLYRDQIMPIYFNVRGRFIEFNSEKIAPEHIMGICNRKPDIFNVVSNGVLNETFIYLVEEPSWFRDWVDRNDLTDVYSADMWEQFFNFIKNYKDDEGNEYFPGSIYGMSRVMQRMQLPFLEGMSLGTICHIVQLAIRLKKYLVYDLKTLKPSDIVKNGEFTNITERAEDSEAPGTAPAGAGSGAAAETKR